MVRQIGEVLREKPKRECKYRLPASVRTSVRRFALENGHSENSAVIILLLRGLFNGTGSPVAGSVEAP
jgi:hypothetical protein